jgi:hypothetical protein
MKQEAIFSPFFAMMLLTFIVWIYMYVRRIRFITNRKLTPKELEPIAFAQLSPPTVSNPSDNLKNLFEMPIIGQFKVEVHHPLKTALGQC